MHGAFSLRIRPMVCGDGIRTPSEECDDGNTQPGDGCDESCRSETPAVAEVEPNDVRAQAQTVPVGSTFLGSLPPGDRDFVAVDLVAGHSYSFTLHLGGRGECTRIGQEDPEIDLFAPGGEPVAWATSCEPGSSAYTAPATGRYFLRIHERMARDVPSYTLEVREAGTGGQP